MPFQPPRPSRHVLTAYRYDQAAHRFDCVYACCGSLTMAGEIAEQLGCAPGCPPGECPICLPDQYAAPLPNLVAADGLTGGWLWTPLELAFDVEPIIAHRSFRIVRYHRRGNTSELRIASLTDREVWEPRAATRATCQRSVDIMFSLGPSAAARTDVHEAPWPDCSCGIWATRDPADAPALDLVGTVKLWGRVLEFRHGWRAELAYPNELTLRRIPAWLDPPEEACARLDYARTVCKQLERAYGIPVHADVSEPKITTIQVASLNFPGVSFGVSVKQAAAAFEATSRAIAKSLGRQSDAAMAMSLAAERQKRILQRRALGADKPKPVRRSCQARHPHGPHVWKEATVPFQCSGVQSRAALRPTKTHRGRL